MSVTIGIWVVPTLLSAFIALWPVDNGSDTYGVGSLFSGGLKLICLLVVWLIYFAVT